MLVRGSNENEKAAIAGGTGAKHIHTLAEAYGATVIYTRTIVLKNYYLGLMDY
jgi:hypothetical protein